MAMKHEWRKHEKELYVPKAKPVALTVPAMKFFTVAGQGNPNDPAFVPIIEVLYALSYRVRMSPKQGDAPDGYFDYTVYPLEGVWDINDEAKKEYNGTINKDDLVFELSHKALKKFGSQGQQKTYLLALKLAQASLIQNISKQKVIILLDDIYDKLDGDRMKHLLNIVGSGDFGQIFITDTDLERIPKILEKEKINFKSFNIKDGAGTNG